jgi:hypothetical protein
MERLMTKLTLVSAAVIAVAAFTSQAAVARSDAAAHHAMAAGKASGAADCVRAPNVGAFASAPYTTPPCLPNSAN